MTRDITIADKLFLFDEERDVYTLMVVGKCGHRIPLSIPHETLLSTGTDSNMLQAMVRESVFHLEHHGVCPECLATRKFSPWRVDPAMVGRN